MACLPQLFSMDELHHVAPGFVLEENAEHRSQRAQLASKQQDLQAAIDRAHTLLARDRPPGMIDMLLAMYAEVL